MHANGSITPTSKSNGHPPTASPRTPISTWRTRDAEPRSKNNDHQTQSAGHQTQNTWRTCSRMRQRKRTWRQTRHCASCKRQTTSAKGKSGTTSAKGCTREGCTTCGEGQRYRRPSPRSAARASEYDDDYSVRTCCMRERGCAVSTGTRRHAKEAFPCGISPMRHDMGPLRGLEERGNRTRRDKRREKQRSETPETEKRDTRNREARSGKRRKDKKRDANETVTPRNGDMSNSGTDESGTERERDEREKCTYLPFVTRRMHLFS